ncbi:phage tail protein [Trueperella bialowiezensis]|uniref:Phage-related protein n=1 Tax=Trueperella bialowiezensis TaxID=312285 RepID=A0A3S4X6P5_9ACTO|nr:tape measure protein [Trueperella bialowiezensis]VEI13845.1 Phage-related protein [Trueperella bialowiezensis]
MADSSFGLKIGLEGEREFKRAITDINREMRVLGSEMKLVASQFDKNDQSASALTARNQVLSKEIDAQKSKIETLRAALDNSAASFGENDSRTKNWQIQLNNAQAVLNGLEKELADNNSQLDSFADHTDEAGDDAADAAKDASKLEDAVDELGGELDDTAGKTRTFGDVLKANLASEAIVAGVKGIVSAVAGVAKGFASAMKDGVEYNARMEQYTTSFTTMLGDQAKAQQLVNDLKVEAARTPFGMEDLAKNTQTLMAFGISADEAQLRLKQLGDISQGDAVKLESLTLAFAQMSSTGKLTGQDLNQMINAGFNPLEEISRKTGKSIGELKEEMGKGAISAEMVADAFASATSEGGRFYGAMDAQSKTFSGQLATLEDGVANLKGLLATGLSESLAGTVLPMVNGWVDELTAAFEQGGTPALLDTLGDVLQEALTFIAEQLPVVVESGMSILLALIEGIIEVLPSLAETAVQLVTALVEALIEALPLLLEAAIEVIATLATGIGEALPELIPAAVEMITTLVTSLVENLPLLLDAALQLIMGLAEGLIAALPVLIESLPQIIRAIIDFLVAAIPQLIDTGIRLLTALVDALPQIISAIVAVLPQIVSAIVDGIIRLVGQVAKAGVRLLTALISELPQIISTVVSGVGQLLESILRALAGGVSRMASAGADLVRGLWNGIQSLAGWLWDKVSSWCSDIWDGILGFFGIHSPSKEMAWVGHMLTEGLADGITATGKQAVDAAHDMASDTLAAMTTLTEGITVPVTTTVDPVRVPDIELAPMTAHTSQAFSDSRSGSGVDVASVVDQTTRRVLQGLDIKVVLNDGTLVGKLAPGLNRQLARLSNHHSVLTGGVI